MDLDKSREYGSVKLHAVFLLTLTAILVWSVIDCHNPATWFLEAFPVIAGVGLLVVVYRRFQFTNLTYFLIWVHAVILLIGAHYTYARMPLFNWLRDAFELSRNHYDRVGHFVQGFVPAIIAREVFWRRSPLRGSKWLAFLVVCFCLGFGALFELFEWIVAVIAKEGAVAYLATQGDEWDTQKDMGLCLLGAISALLVLGKVHTAALREIGCEKKR